MFYRILSQSNANNTTNDQLLKYELCIHIAQIFKSFIYAIKYKNELPDNFYFPYHNIETRVSHECSMLAHTRRKILWLVGIVRGEISGATFFIMVQVDMTLEKYLTLSMLILDAQHTFEKATIHIYIQILMCMNSIMTS